MSCKTTFLTHLILLIGIFSTAQVATPFTERFSQSLEGDVTIIANNMISEHATNPYNGDGDNGGFLNSTFVDVDADNTTFNSSSANFVNPETTEPCITILRAFLYWAGADSNGVNGWDFNEVKLMLPGDTAYTTVQADNVIYQDANNEFNNRPYVCVRDITPDVARLGLDIYGNYQVANVMARENHFGNAGTAAGWQIVFVYESQDLPAKNITIFDGYAHIESGNGNATNVDVNFNGFVTVPNGAVNGNVVIGSLEGDRGITGDHLQIRNIAGNFVDLAAPQRDANNFFNSRITVGNGDFVNRNPASTNTLGFDAAVFELDNPNNTILNNQSTATTLRITSDREVYGVYLLGLAVEVYKPNLDPMLVTQTSGSATPNPGDIIGFNVNIENHGNDDTVNLALSANLPQQIVFVPPATLPPGVTYTYNELPDNRLVYNIADGLLDIGSPALSIDMEFQVKDDCFFLEEDCDLDFELEFEAAFNGATNPDDPLISISTIDPTTCLDTPVVIEIIQPTIDWATPPLDLNRTLSCEDTAGLDAAQLLAPITDKCNPFQFITLNKIAGAFVPDPDCPNAGTYTNTWNFTDACGVTIADYVQTITITDVIAPTASNPAAINVQCMADVPTQDPLVVIDEADNCSTPTVAFVSESADGTSCPITITRIYSVTDACGNTINVNQTIIVNDNIAPELSTSYEPNISIGCQDVPEAPSLVFTDNCTATTDIRVGFEEREETVDASNYTIIRTWTATDACGNESVHTQEIVVATSGATDNQSTTICVEDPSIDLNSFVSNTSDLTGTWSSDDITLLNGSVFDPLDVEVGDYEFTYTYTNALNCVFSTRVVVNVHRDCIQCEKALTDSINVSKLVTPNNDGLNDFLSIKYDIKNSHSRLCAFSISLDIYNRWGTRVYSNANYDNTWKGESPEASLGASGKLPTGTYYYVVKFNDTAEEIDPIQGYILLGSN